MNISKILSYVVMAVGALGVILWFVMNNAFDTMLAENDVSEARELPEAIAVPAVDPLYTLTLIVFALVVIFTVYAVVSTLVKSPDSLKKTMLGIGAFLLVLGVSYGIAEGVETPMKDGEVLSADGSKMVGAGLNAFYILAFVAVGSMFTAGIKKLIST